nr:uncharacterized protein LOC123276717 [Equus asinus]
MDYLTIEVEEEAMTPADASLPQKQSTEEMESTVELLPVEFQELVTVKDEEMDFAHVEVDQLNSAQRNMGLDLKVESCGSLVFWGDLHPRMFPCSLLALFLSALPITNTTELENPNKKMGTPRLEQPGDVIIGGIFPIYMTEPSSPLNFTSGPIKENSEERLPSLQLERSKELPSPAGQKMRALAGSLLYTQKQNFRMRKKERAEKQDEIF